MLLSLTLMVKASVHTHSYVRDQASLWKPAPYGLGIRRWRCRIMELCAGVCIVGVRARVLARARARVLRRRRRTSLLTLEAARPFPSCRTTGPRCEREGTRHRPCLRCSRKFFFPLRS